MRDDSAVIGIMQGRLSPPDPRRLQAFPWNGWEQEFARVRACGLDGIEWLFEAEQYADNPLWRDEGCARIRDLVAAEGAPVLSVCGDYFMPHPLFRGSAAARDESRAVLRRLIVNAASIGARTILIPVLEEAELEDASEWAALVEALRSSIDLLERHDVRLGLETELPAKEYLTLVDACAHPSIGAYYDMGNSAAKGHDVPSDLELLAPVLVGVHVKDRPRGGGSVPLGEGSVPFDAAFAVLARTGYRGAVVLQSAFGADFEGFARRHAAFVRTRVNAAWTDGRDARGAAR